MSMGSGVPDVSEVHRALAHPLRARILASVGTRTTSPVELATELAEPLGVVSYHVRVLRERGLLVPAGTSPRRGALQHHYRLAEDAPIVLRLAVQGLEPEELAAQLRALPGVVAGDEDPGVTMTVVIQGPSGTSRR